MRRIFYLLKKIILLAALASAGWYGYRSLLETPEDLQRARAYLPMVHPATASQVRDLVLSGVNANRPTLLYVFESDGILSRWNYNDIQYFASRYNRSQLNVLMVAVDETPLETAGLIYKKGGSKVHMLILQPPGRLADDSLYAELYRLGAKSFERGSYPFIAVINKAGHLEKVQFGWDRKNKINGMIERALNPKS